jgi:hypothetical protein
MQRVQRDPLEDKPDRQNKSNQKDRPETDSDSAGFVERAKGKAKIPESQTFSFAVGHQ